ncbi:hypothetical protein [Streptomyces antimicrobicus]|uniref:Histidine kinase n=1 Tax=Streptomyces antimicrobicus TaxID=2883108 RepID=A0ABS8BEY8_9ACTN|nr:hypothetical protein [Streptomyces antimicrobicus]MCB5183175.1 hypothetical protein [Streptomyces antimicrobicus]
MGLAGSRPGAFGRWAVGLLGVLLIGIGGRCLAAEPDPYAVLLWLAGALVLHDAVLAPLVFAAGLLLAVLPARPVVRGALISGAALTLITLPLLLRPGAPPNPSALPLPYARNLLLSLAAVAAAAALLALITRARRHRARPTAEAAPRRPAGGPPGPGTPGA